MGYLNKLIQTSSSQLSSVYQFTDAPYIDLSDQLNWQITVNVLVVLIFMLTNISKFVSKRISCAVPIYFTENHEEYANLMCYISEHKYAANESNTILIAPNQTLVYYHSNNSTSNWPHGPKLIGSYYVWVPYVLVLLVVLVILVRLLWMYLLKRLYRHVDLDELLRAAARCRDVPIEKFLFFDSKNHININRLLFRNHNIR